MIRASLGWVGFDFIEFIMLSRSKGKPWLEDGLTGSFKICVRNIERRKPHLCRFYQDLKCLSKCPGFPFFVTVLMYWRIRIWIFTDDKFMGCLSLC